MELAMKIEIITTLNAQLKETGFGTQLACDDVFTAIKQMGHEVLITTCSALKDLQGVVKRKPDLVVLAAKYMPVSNKNNIWFSEYFAKNNIVFSGSSRETLKFDSNKILAKEKLALLGIRTAKHFTAIPEEYKLEENLPFSFPLFLKPTDAANGNGIDDQSFVVNFDEFKAKVLSLYLTYNQPVLVEEYLAGREFTVAVMRSAKGNIHVSAIELIPPVSSGTLRILGAVVKANDTETVNVLRNSDVEPVTTLAAMAFLGLGVRGFGRIDVKMDNNGICYFMEANLVPGMNSQTSYFPRACQIVNNLPYCDVIKLMLDESFNRAVIAKQSLDDIEEQEAMACPA
jgi:D-alanine-D-alanine ligase